MVAGGGSSFHGGALSPVKERGGEGSGLHSPAGSRSCGLLTHPASAIRPNVPLGMALLSQGPRCPESRAEQPRGSRALTFTW